MVKVKRESRMRKGGDDPKGPELFTGKTEGWKWKLEVRKKLIYSLDYLSVT